MRTVISISIYALGLSLVVFGFRVIGFANRLHPELFKDVLKQMADEHPGFKKILQGLKEYD